MFIEIITQVKVKVILEQELKKCQKKLFQKLSSELLVTYVTKQKNATCI